MNEKSFQEFLEKNFSFSHGIGIGDDAAVITGKNSDCQVITKDILIENVHFKLDYFSFEELAQKAVKVNLSDIAAMGAVPEFFFLGLGIPKKHQKEIKSFFNGIKQCCDLYNIELAGGDYSSSDQVFISITMMGRIEKPILRKISQSGDYICITNNPGESALGLSLLQKKKMNEMEKDELFFINKHKRIVPEVKKGQILSKYVNSMIDISDGLIKDLNRILYASNKGGVIHYDQIPVSDEFKSVCKKHNIDEESLVLGGGEDYGLLFTISKEKKTLLDMEGILYKVIGEVLDSEELKIKKNNKFLKNKFSGYDHFKM